MTFRFRHVHTCCDHAPIPLAKQTAALVNWRREQAIADRAAAKIGRAIRRYFRGVSSIVDGTIEPAIEMGDPAAAVGVLQGLPAPTIPLPGEDEPLRKNQERLIELEAAISESLMGDTVAASMESGAAAWAALDGLGLDVVGSFAISNPYVAPAAQARVGWLIQEVRRGTADGLRDAIAAAVEAGYEEQITPKILARRIRPQVGLRPDQVRALGNLRGRLAAAGLKGAKLDRRMEREAAKRLRYRADMIARTEAHRAAATGRHDAWKEARDKGFFRGQIASVEWVAGITDRTCPICADLHGVREPLGGTFSPTNESGNLTAAELSVEGETPPIHPLCRCSTILILE